MSTGTSSPPGSWSRWSIRPYSHEDQAAKGAHRYCMTGPLWSEGVTANRTFSASLGQPWSAESCEKAPQKTYRPVTAIARGTVMLSISANGRLSTRAPTKDVAALPHVILPRVNASSGPSLPPASWSRSMQAMLASMPAVMHAPEPAQLCAAHSRSVRHLLHCLKAHHSICFER